MWFGIEGIKSKDLRLGSKSVVLFVRRRKYSMVVGWATAIFRSCKLQIFEGQEAKMFLHRSLDSLS